MAEAFLDHGAKVALVDIDTENLEAAVARLQRKGGHVIGRRLDVTDQAAWHQVVEDVKAMLGPVEILCNNAGVAGRGALETLKPSVWNRFVEINLNAVFYGMQACIGQMKEAGGGHIVNTSSMAGLMAGSPNMGAYAATKHAVVAVSEVMRAEFASAGIGVSVLCPGPVKTSLWRTSRAAMELPPVDTPPPENMTGSAAPYGLEPYRVGLRVIKAIIDGEFYVVTAPELGGIVEKRLGAVQQAIDYAREMEPMLRPT
jgi:NAD(P)-dependent dehydrogenase (short-subunit alcohol dehydrogenase family)